MDIDSNLIFCSDDADVFIYSLANKPTVVYDFNDYVINLGTDAGLIAYHREKELETKCTGFPLRSAEIDSAEYRSNDGGDCGAQRLLGFMHRKSPKSYPGFVYRVSGQQYKLLDNNISIPNTFVALSSNQTLVSDSLTGDIWCLELDAYGGLKSKKLWSSLIGESPDGGCRFGDYVLIAIWDAAEIAVFTIEGKLVQRLSVPVLRPTNCKYDFQSSKLWMTSAKAGLTQNQLAEYPDSGKTMVFNLRTS